MLSRAVYKLQPSTGYCAWAIRANLLTHLWHLEHNDHIDHFAERRQRWLDAMARMLAYAPAPLDWERTLLVHPNGQAFAGANPGEILRGRMGWRGLTVTELARRAGVSRRTVERWLAGENPSPAHRAVLARELEGSPNDYA